MEDSNLSGTERTKRLILESLKGIESYLDFTVESGEDEEYRKDGGWLPTLDTSMKVEDNNQVVFKFYQKPMSRKMTVQMESALEENSKMKILSNDLIRRLLSSSEELGGEEKNRIVDEYAEMLLSSGYNVHVQKTREIILSGIKGYETKRMKCLKEGVPLRRTARQSGQARLRKKLTTSSSWFKIRRSRDEYLTGEGWRKGKEKNKTTVLEKKIRQKSVIFVEQTRMGELPSLLRSMMTRLAPTLGFSVKVVERAGASLRNMFSQGGLWDGVQCGRGEECVPCSQDAETNMPCTRVSAVYETFCTLCNPEAKGSREIQATVDPPSVYVGERGRSIQERLREHHDDEKKRSNKSHMWKHRVLHHQGGAAPFVVKAVSFHRTALYRQAAEAVSIRRRGGEGMILNSRAEFNRCFIPRLTLIQDEVARRWRRKKRDCQPKSWEILAGIRKIGKGTESG